jgi:hypothetical protein
MSSTAESTPATDEVKLSVATHEEDFDWNDEDFAFDELDRIGDPRTPGCLKMRDKIVFFGGVLNVILLAFFTSGVPWIMPWYYVVKAPILIGTRICLYFKDKFQYFLIDFCYWANLLLLVYLIFIPNSKELFVVCYALAHGPLAWAVCLFKNSLVFHSLDKITSCFIHCSPMLVTYCLRWYAEKFPEDERFKVCAAGDSCANFMWTAIVPMIVYLTWFIVYGISIKWICPMPSKDYLTSYRYLTRQRGGPLKMLGKMKFGWLVYAAINSTASFLMLCPTIAFYNNQTLNFVFAAIIISVAIYNGGGFYIEVFSKKYNKSIEKELKDDF